MIIRFFKYKEYAYCCVLFNDEIGFYRFATYSDNKYCHSDVTGISIMTKFSIGNSHCYYDGTHCSYAFGYIYLHWYNPNCKKCLE